MAESIEDVAARFAALTGNKAVERDLAAHVAEELKASGYTDLQNVVAEYRAGVLILRGSVRSYFMKQTAQELSRRVSGVEQIDNRLSVAW